MIQLSKRLQWHFMAIFKWIMLFACVTWYYLSVRPQNWCRQQWLRRRRRTAAMMMMMSIHLNTEIVVRMQNSQTQHKIRHNENANVHCAMKLKSLVRYALGILSLYFIGCSMRHMSASCGFQRSIRAYMQTHKLSKFMFNLLNRLICFISFSRWILSMENGFRTVSNQYMRNILVCRFSHTKIENAIKNIHSIAIVFFGASSCLVFGVACV